MSLGGPSQTELFFAFIDGVYDYVCAECTALCCKGHGFAGSLEREMRTLFARYPQLETMAISRDGDQINLATPGNCLMLDSANLCRIEKELGKDQKPNVCKIFPFNSFSRVGKTVVVMPHFLCPLRATVPVRPGHVQGTHALIEADIHQSRMLDRDYIKTMVPPVRLHPAITATAALEREEAFRNLCARGLGSKQFSEVLMAASSDPAGLKTFRRRALHVLGYEPVIISQTHDVLDDLLLAFASPYRIGFLDLTAEEILRVLVLGELMARRTWPADGQIPTFQSVANTIIPFRVLQMLLAHGEEPCDFGRVTQKTFSFRDSELTFAAFITVQLSAQQGVLTALEHAIPPTMSVSDRSILLMRLGELMHITMHKKRRKHGVVVDKILDLQDEGHEAQGLPSMAA